MTDPEDHKTVWEACKHPLAEQEVIEKSCPTVFVSKLGLMVLVIFQIFIYIAFLPHWSTCQEHKEVKVTFEKLHIYTSPRALFLSASIASRFYIFLFFHQKSFCFKKIVSKLI